MAIALTIAIYGLVACIVKIDDLGVYLQEKGKDEGLINNIGNGLISLSPKLIKVLTIVGTIAMFLVGGGNIEHNIPAIHNFTDSLLMPLEQIPIISTMALLLIKGIIGFIIG